MFIGSQGGCLSAVKFLLDHQAQADLALHTNATPLYVACQNGHLQVAEVLLAFGAHPNSQTNDLATPLFIAAQMGHFRIVQKLLEFKGEIERANRTKATPLFIASQQPGFHGTIWTCFGILKLRASDVQICCHCVVVQIPAPHSNISKHLNRRRYVLDSMLHSAHLKPFLD